MKNLIALLVLIQITTFGQTAFRRNEFNQYLVTPTNSLGIPLATANNVLYSWTNITGTGTANNMNLDSASVVRTILQSNLPPHITIISDDAFGTHDGLPAALTNYLKLNGSGGVMSTMGIGNYYYQTTNGIGNFGTISGTGNDGDDPFWPISHYFMANGSAMTNVSQLVNGWPTTIIQIRGWKANNAGNTLGVYTNAYGSTPVLCKTLVTDAATVTPYITNWNIPYAPNLIVSARSVGTNILADMGQWDTNKNSGAVWTVWNGSHFGLTPFIGDTFRSNAFRVFMEGQHGLIVDDISGSNEIYTALSQAVDMRSTMPTWFDIYETSLVSPTNDLPGMLVQNSGLRNAARAFGIGVIDVTSIFYDQTMPARFGWFNDTVHLHKSDAVGPQGQIYAGAKIAQWLGWDYASIGPYGWTNLALYNQFGIPNQAKLTGGNTFSSGQAFTSTLNTFGGQIMMTGTLATVTMTPRDNQTIQQHIYSSAGHIYRADSSETQPWENKFNNGGQMSLNWDAYNSDANAMQVGNTRPIIVWQQQITKTGNYTLTAVDVTVVFNGSSLTATLPSAVTMGRGKRFDVKNINASALTIATTSSQTIDATTPVAVTVGQCRTYLSDGANWFIIGGY